MLQIELYIREITRFLSTVTLKNVYFRDQMEDQWVNDYFKGNLPDKLQPYYRHLNGDYILKDLSTFRKTTGITAAQMSDAAVCDTYGLSLSTTIGGKVYSNSEIYTQFDELIMVNSVDTKQPVPFTKRMLASKAHQKTASLYRIPSRYYSNLCSKYPEYVDMIKAIVYPIPSIDAAIAAENYDIISCDLQQLRENERTSLYTCLLKTLAVIKRRWDVKDFVYEDLYALSMQGKIWSILLLALFKQRVANIRTSAAHEFHIWEYLKSHGIEDYSSVLSLNQAIFLYRNFPYILRNRGTDFNLILLAHKLLSEWDIQIQGKNLLQQTNDSAEGGDQDMTEKTTIDEVTGEEKDTPSATPVVDSAVIGKVVLTALRTIDDNEASGDKNLMYLNKTMKASDELESFSALANDLQEMSVGTIETLEDTFEKEQESELEYQDDALFATSTAEQTNLFTYTPNTYLPTKLLEITKASASTLFKQIYAKFVTESLFYQVYLGNADYNISFMPEGSVYSINMTVKEAIAFSVYCWLKECGQYTKGQKLYPEMILTVPYKEEFPEIPETYRWNNLTDLKTSDQLDIRPTKLVLESETLSDEALGVYYLQDRTVSSYLYVWKNANECMLRFVSSENNSHWELSTSGATYRFESDIPYKNQKKWSQEWTHGGYTHQSTLTVTEYEYIIDDWMPLYDTTTYDELMSLINLQALGYLQIYQELHNSDYSRQRLALEDVVDSRTFKGVISLDLLDGKSLDDLVNDNADLKSVVEKIEANPVDVRPSEYGKLGNAVIKAIVPIESEYIEDTAGVAANRYTKLKELFVSLCSYNITFVEGSADSDSSSMTLTSFVTQDMMEDEMFIELHSYVDLITEHTTYDYGVKEYMYYIEITTQMDPYAPDTPLQIEYRAMSEEEIKLEIQLVADSVDFKEEEAYIEGKFSPKFIKFLRALEKHFNMTIAMDDLKTCTIPDTFVDYIAERIKQHARIVNENVKVCIGESTFDDVTRVSDLDVIEP